MPSQGNHKVQKYIFCDKICMIKRIVKTRKDTFIFNPEYLVDPGKNGFAALLLSKTTFVFNKISGIMSGIQQYLQLTFQR